MTDAPRASVTSPTPSGQPDDDVLGPSKPRLPPAAAAPRPAAPRSDRPLVSLFTLTLHVLPKGAGLVLFLVGAEVAGVRLPRAGRVPLPVAGLALVLAAEVALQWTA